MYEKHFVQKNLCCFNNKIKMYYITVIKLYGLHKLNKLPF